jgi:ubiquitin-protein ligase
MIKIITDLSTFCYTDSKHEKSIQFNTDIIFIIKTDVSIIMTLNNVFSETKMLEYDDKYHIYNNVNEFTKYKVDYNALVSISDNTIINDKNTSYKLLSNTMIKKIIIAEMKMINTNPNHNHYIFSNDNTIFNLTLRIFLDDKTVLGKQLKENIEYKYIELNISLDSKGYPYIAPKITYIKPNADISFIMSIMNLDILKHTNWSHVISLETLVLALVEQLHTLDKQYIKYNDNDIDIDVNKEIFLVIQELDSNKNKIQIKNNQLIFNNNIRPCILHGVTNYNLINILKKLNYNINNIKHRNYLSYLLTTSYFKKIIIIIFIIIILLNRKYLIDKLISYNKKN